MDEPGFISIGISIHTGQRMYTFFPLNWLFVLIGAIFRRSTSQLPVWMVEE
jgi:hypothetical protein